MGLAGPSIFVILGDDRTVAIDICKTVDISIMGKVLGIVGSPRKKGNTYALVESVLKGAEAEGADTEIVQLSDMTIKECDGCHACWKGRPCPKRDDMDGIYCKIGESDVIVLGTPIYWYAPTALMKCLLDRFVYFNCPENRPMVRGKSAILVIPFEDTDLGSSVPAVRIFQMSLDYLEMRLFGTVLAPGVARQGEVRNDLERMEEAYQIGQRVMEEI